jgi:ABC-type transporter Mla maintaining outer membrane lipid asymmetry ATPase subunit MlaF
MEVKVHIDGTSNNEIGTSSHYTSNKTTEREVMANYDALPGIGPEKLAKDVEMGSPMFAETGLAQMSTKIQASSNSFNANKTSHDVVWKHINFLVGEKKILDECWGNVPAGTVCAIMGPSGAGKSSLLNVLAGRSASAANIKITGNVHVAGHKINPIKFRERIAYVMQDDSLLATATPREALVFSAQMRLPNATPNEEIDRLVENLLVDLGLEVCADTMIGGALIKGISGGQRKRTRYGGVVCTVCCLLFGVCCVLCAVCCVLCAVCCVLCAVCCVLCAVCCVLFVVCCVLCFVCCVLCAVCCLFCVVCCVLCVVCCVLCTVYCVLYAIGSNSLPHPHIPTPHQHTPSTHPTDTPSVGIELITDPALLFLDEPTSGQQLA